MKKYGDDLKISRAQISSADFMESYNKNTPASFPRVTVALLKKFREAHSSLFKRGDSWSIDLHRKKMMDWLPQNTDLV
ncbi:MAG: hypothetical protein HZA25_01045 [Candidatus Niyogibacteria bacterium]|nr:hypothetical protein [Candidatus Niyogibacteria bacterium]